MEDVSAWVQKKELLKLTTPQLIRLCKQRNVSTWGKKSELVSRLIAIKHKSLTKHKNSQRPRAATLSRSTSASSKRNLKKKTFNKPKWHSQTKLPSSKLKTRTKKGKRSIKHPKSPTQRHSKPNYLNPLNLLSPSTTETIIFPKISEKSPSPFPPYPASAEPISDSKSIAIPRLKSKTKLKLKPKPIAVDVSDLTIKQSMDNLFNGYTRINYQSIHEYPTTLISLFYAFSGNVITRFDSYSPKYKSTIHKNGFVIKRIEQSYYKNDGVYKKLKSSVYLVGCSNGYNYGVHSWRVKIHQPCNDYIGIISDIDVTKRRIIGLYAAPTNSYYYSIEKSVICCGKNTDVTFKSVRCRKRKFSTRKRPGMDHDDANMNVDVNMNKNVLRIELNCEVWSVKFYKDEKLLGREMFITPDCTYYLTIECRCDYTMYTLLE